MDLLGAPGAFMLRLIVLDIDGTFRSAAFAYIDELTERSGGLVTREELEQFVFQGKRVPLVEKQKGIRKVAWLEAAVSILTTYVRDPTKAPYADGVGADGYLRYKWRGTNGATFDNRALRLAMTEGKPLIWLVGVEPGVFEVHHPVWLVDEEPEQHQFVMAVESTMREQWGDVFHPVDLALRRQYVDVIVRQRVHQRLFRDRVLLAYEGTCALCRLRHPELLDAAHIKEDSDGGEPIVTNGIAMCAIHHRAFDSDVFGIRPGNHVIEVRPDVLIEHDGPTLRYALQELHETKLSLPRQKAARPDSDLLEERWQRFQAAG